MAAGTSCNEVAIVQLSASRLNPPDPLVVKLRMEDEGEGY